MNRDFSAQKPGQKWVSAITCIRTGEGGLYLTAILDLADTKVVGWALSDRLKAADTRIAAWQMALKNRPLDGALLFPSERGVQYACIEFGDQFKELPVLQSMRGLPEQSKGNGWDNAVAESFLKTLKCAMVNDVHFETRHQAKLARFEYIEGWYNRRGKPSTLDYQAPLQGESYFFTSSVAA